MYYLYVVISPLSTVLSVLGLPRCTVELTVLAAAELAEPALVALELVACAVVRSAMYQLTALNKLRIE